MGIIYVINQFLSLKSASKKFASYPDWLGIYRIRLMSRLSYFVHFKSIWLQKKILKINMGIRYLINPFLGLKSAFKKFASYPDWLGIYRIRLMSRLSYFIHFESV